jgi:hypothetical protein
MIILWASMEYLLFFVYLAFFAWLVTRTTFFLSTGLTRPQLVIIFLLKVIAGIFYGWMGLYYGGLAQMVDTWGFHYNGLAEYRLLGTRPAEYFTNIFNDPYLGEAGSFFASSNSFWNDLKSNVFIKLLSIFDIFSFGHYYVNVIFYSFITLIGPLAFYKVMNDVFPRRRLLLLFTVSFIPSFYYWASGLHKDGLIFTGLAMIIYHIYFAAKEKRFSARRIMYLLLWFLLLLVLRNFMVVILLPAILAWLLAIRWPKYALHCFVAVYFVSGILFFGGRYVDPRLDFPRAVVDKQQAYIQMVPGNSSMPIKQLKANVGSFIKNIPQAISLAAIRPYPNDIYHLLSMAAALEINLILLFLLVFLFWRRRDGPSSWPLIWFSLFFSFSLLLVVGFTVNNLGAIVRYRSIILPLLVTPMILSINWTKISSYFSRDISYKNNVNKIV